MAAGLSPPSIATSWHCSHKRCWRWQVHAPAEHCTACCAHVLATPGGPQPRGNVLATADAAVLVTAILMGCVTPAACYRCLGGGGWGAAPPASPLTAVNAGPTKIQTPPVTAQHSIGKLHNTTFRATDARGPLGNLLPAPKWNGCLLVHVSCVHGCVGGCVGWYIPPAKPAACSCRLRLQLRPSLAANAALAQTTCPSRSSSSTQRLCTCRCTLSGLWWPRRCANGAIKVRQQESLCPVHTCSHTTASLLQHQVQLCAAQPLTPQPAAPPETALLVQGAPAHTALPPDSSLCW